MKIRCFSKRSFQKFSAFALLVSSLPALGVAPLGNNISIQIVGTGDIHQANVTLHGETISSGPTNGYYGNFALTGSAATAGVTNDPGNVATFTSTSTVNPTGPLDFFQFGLTNFALGSGAVITIDPGSTITFPSGTFLFTDASFDFSKLIAGTYSGIVDGGGFAGGTTLTLIILALQSTPATSATPGAATPVVTLHLINESAIYSVLESGLPLAAEQREIVFNLTRTALRDVGNRLFCLRAGLSLGDDAAAGSAGPTGVDLVRHGSNGKDIEAKDSREVVDPFHHVQLYAAGDFGAFDLDDMGDSHGFGQDVWVGTVGAEYRVNQHLAFGLAASYINSRSEISQQIGSSNVEGAAVSTYGSAAWRSFYVDALYSFGTYEENINRHTLVGRGARGDAEGHTNTIQINTGYTIKLGSFHTGPLASLDWIHGDLAGYSENGGGSAALDFDGQHFDSLISRVGWQASYTIPIKAGTITPQIRASWDHEYLDSADSVGATLQNSPFATITGTKVSTGGKFGASMETAEPGRDYLSVGAGIAIQLSDRWSASLDYETHIFQDSETVHLASAKIGVSF